MMTISLEEVTNTLVGQVPYTKSLRVSVVAVDSVRSYHNDRRNQRQVLNCAVADATKAVKAVVYDSAKFARFQEGNSLLIRNFIKKPDGIVVTSATKVYPTHQEEVPDAIRMQGVHIIRPPPAPVQPIKDALRSPVKTKVSVMGCIVQEDAPHQVTVNNDKVKIRAIYLKDATHPKCKISLWRDVADTEFRTGDYIKITNVVVNVFRGETSLNSTSQSTIEKTEAQEEEVIVEVAGACVEELDVLLLLQDDTEMTVPLGVMTRITEERDIEAYILSLCNPTFTMKITSKGSNVVKVEFPLE